MSVLKKIKDFFGVKEDTYSVKMDEVLATVKKAPTKKAVKKNTAKKTVKKAPAKKAPSKKAAIKKPM
jgi:hypothetical protein